VDGGARQFGIEDPDAGELGGAQNGGFGPHDDELAGAHVDTHRANNARPGLAAFGEQGGAHDAVEDLDAEAQHLLIQDRLDFGAAPDTDVGAGRVVIGEHDLGLFIAKWGAGEFVFFIAEFHAHVFDVEQGVPGLAHDNVADHAVRV
jgi:hypothetical protein